MKCYIYFLINQVTKQRYVGQTTNFSRRKNEHLSKLREGRHPNPKLQSSFNKYGEENFIFEKIVYDNLTKQELNEQEIYYISKYDSFRNGYNLTEGGTGGNTRSKLNFDEFCFAYFGNKKYEGMTRRTGDYLGVDSSCIASIKREESYDVLREQANKLSAMQQEQYIKDFENKLDLQNNPPWIKQKTLDDDTTLKIMCVVSTYGRGIEKAVLSHFHLSKGFIYHLMTGKGRQKVKDEYRKLNMEERQVIGKKYFVDWQLQKYSFNKINEAYTDLLLKYKK